MAEQIDLPDVPLLVSDEALFRSHVVDAVRVALLEGKPLAEAVVEVAAKRQPYRDRRSRKVSERTVYRWFAAFRAGGLAALEPRARRRTARSLVLEEKLVHFLIAEKKRDPRASIPELIRRARERELIEPTRHVDRVTVYRAVKRTGLPLTRPQARRLADVRRFAFPHRMMLVLADGKHFRAGVERKRRVAFFFLDDASRMALHVRVGPSESSALFLGALYQLILRHGLMDVLYLDHGPGFFNHDVARVCRQLGVLLVLGQERCPECHGKIERFHQGPQECLLRALVDPGVDATPGALDLRLAHYLDHQYNRTPHESLALCTPLERWQADVRELRFPASTDELRRRFTLGETRSVSADNVLAFQGVDYEVPRGHANTRIEIHRGLIEGTLSILHDGHMVRLHPVDLTANAYARRARMAPEPPTPDSATRLDTAARMAFERDFGALTDPDGNYRGQPPPDPTIDSTTQPPSHHPTILAAGEDPDEKES